MAIYKAIIQPNNQNEELREPSTLYVSFSEKNETMESIIKGLAIKLFSLESNPSLKSVRKVKHPKGDVLFVYLGSNSTSGRSSIELYQMMNKWEKENLIYVYEEFILEIGSVKHKSSKYHLFEQFS